MACARLKTARCRRTAGASLVAMPNLQLPTSEVRGSFLEAMAEFAAERRGAPVDQTMIGHEIRTFGETWHTTEGFASFVRSLRAEAHDLRRPQAGSAASTPWSGCGPR